MSHSFHPEAEAELLAAIDYYEDCEEGLGIDFAVEVQSAIDCALGRPSRADWRSLGKAVSYADAHSDGSIAHSTDRRRVGHAAHDR